MNIPPKYSEYYEKPTLDIPFETARSIFEYQKYEDPPMRGRQSVNPLNKLGFSIARENYGNIIITDLGNKYLTGDYDIGYVFLKSLLKLQFPNPWSTDFSERKGFNVMPLMAALHFIRKVDERFERKGLTQTEFSLFVPTLVNFALIDRYVDELLKYRESRDKEKFIYNFAKWFYDIKKPTEVQINNFFEYGDNIMRYFRLTRYFSVTRGAFGSEWRIDVEPSRETEVKLLLEKYNGSALSFKSKEDYLSYISDISKPELPSDNINSVKRIAMALITDIKKMISSNNVPMGAASNDLLNVNIADKSKREIDSIIAELRNLNIEIKETITKMFLRGNVEQLQNIVRLLRDYRAIRKLSPEEFEKVVADALIIIDDEINIKANFPVDDNGEPISHAPGNRPDIECFYKSYNAICEVTLNTSNMQWVSETQPVMRHLREFELKHSKSNSYCLFIAPKIHGDTLYHFWVSIKHGYNGPTKQKIIPMTTEQFAVLLETLIILLQKGKKLSHVDVESLYEKIVTETDKVAGYAEWSASFPGIIDNWRNGLIVR